MNKIIVCRSDLVVRCTYGLLKYVSLKFVNSNNSRPKYLDRA